MDWAGRTESCGNAGQTTDSFCHPSRPSGLRYLIQHKRLIQQSELARRAGQMPSHPGNPGKIMRLAKPIRYVFSA